jgi:hypothetical protein
VSDQRTDPSIIDRAPVDVAGNEALSAEIGRLSDELDKALAENAKLNDSIDVVRARILEKYVNKVFVFVASYCGTVAVFLFLCGLRAGFELPESILAIISGSTAVSVIGLIGLVVSGLFGRNSGNG